MRTAEGNGPVHALDAALRARHRRDPPASEGHRARQLQGAHPRRGPRHGRRRRACSSTPPTATTSGARSASTRTSSRPRGRRSSTRWPTPSSRGAVADGGQATPTTRREDSDRRHPARPARPRARGGGGGHRGPALGPALAGPARAGLRGGLRGVAGRGARVRGLERHRRAAPGAARGRRGEGDEVVTSPFSFVASANAGALRARPPGLRRHRRAHAEPRSRRPRRRR